MTKTQITSGIFAGLMAAAALAGPVSAQSTAETTGITAMQAIEIALAEMPGEVEEVDRDRENGIAVFEVSIMTAENREFEVTINAETGDILQIEAEDDDHDDDDDYDNHDEDND